MKNLLTQTGISRFYASLGDGPLVLMMMGVVAFLGLDLLLFDPIPLLDEALLGLMLYGGATELMGRRRRKAAGLAPIDPIDVRRMPAELKTITTRMQVVTEAASRLVGRGAAPQVGSRVRELATDVRTKHDELRSADAFLARRDNDPWQSSRQLTKLEKQAVDLEVRGDDRKLEVARKALAAARAHRETIERRVGQREDTMVELESLSAQIDALGDDLGRLLRGKHDGHFVVRSLGEVDPRIAAVVDALAASAEAEAEVEAAVRKRRRRPTSAVAL